MRFAVRAKVAAAVTKNVKVTDAAIASYYDQNKASQYTVPESREVQHPLSVRKKDGSIDFRRPGRGRTTSTSS